MGLRLGVDIGGTFTDFVAVDEATGRVTVEKCLTTPRHPEEAILTGIAKMEARGDSAGAPFAADIVHATTLVTNAIIEGRGALTGLVTTEGFRDILETGRENRYYVYDLEPLFPAPIVPRSLRRTVRERTYVDGSTVPLDEAALAEIVHDFRRLGVQAIAVMFLHAYRNPANELRARAVIEAVAPEIKVSLSHEVVAQPKEYERLSTTVLDAYVKPITAGYIDRLGERLDAGRHATALSMMLSNGGISPIAIAKDYPIQLVESGPAAGVEAARHYGGLLGRDRVLAFDMGGTTAKLCLVREGKVGRTIKPIVDTAIRRFNAFDRLQRELDEARSQLADRKIIERAKGILMKSRSLGEEEAYALLRQTAMNEKKKVAEIARSVVTAASLLGG